MSGRPPTALRAIAAATTPVVAAASVAVVLLAAGCEGRLPGASPQPSSPTGSAVPAATPGEDGRPARWLLVASGAPAAPRLVLHDLARAGGAVPVAAPPGAPAVAAVAAAPDGTLAVVAPDGRAWTTEAPHGAETGAAWRAMGRANAPGGLPGPVLGAAWTPAGDALLVAAGAPGSGIRRTVIAALPLDGAPGAVADVAAEADGPGLAALPDGDALLVLRDAGDSAVLGRVSAAGSVRLLQQAARAIAAGGGIVAVADDAGVLVGDLAALQRGALPADRLPLEGEGGVGGVAVAPDGAAIAVVRLDDAGRPTRIDVLERASDGWRPGSGLPLDAAVGNALVAWVPGP